MISDSWLDDWYSIWYSDTDGMVVLILDSCWLSEGTTVARPVATVPCLSSPLPPFRLHPFTGKVEPSTQSSPPTLQDASGSSDHRSWHDCRFAWIGRSAPPILILSLQSAFLMSLSECDAACLLLISTVCLFRGCGGELVWLHAAFHICFLCSLYTSVWSEPNASSIPLSNLFLRSSSCSSLGLASVLVLPVLLLTAFPFLLFPIFSSSSFSLRVPGFILGPGLCCLGSLPVAIHYFSSLLLFKMAERGRILLVFLLSHRNSKCKFIFH